MTTVDRRPTVVVAPDKFKGSLTGVEVAAIVARTIHRLAPHAEVREHPIADGGEGTVELALAAGMEPVTVQVLGPMGVPVAATFAVRDDTAVIEMAAAAGLSLLPGPPNRTTAGSASTFGVGQLIAAALDNGARRIVLGLGGSASTDGGAGLAVALGAKLTTAAGEPAPLGGFGLGSLANVDLSGLDPRLRGVEVIAACDVDNPLLGPDGAAAVYGPQKGADAELVTRLDTNLRQWADLIEPLSDRECRHEPGAGAAGGTSFGLMALLGARLLSGVQFMMELVGYEQILPELDLFIVGEGSLDEQSLRGKGPIGAAAAARASGANVVAVVGRNLLTREQYEGAGLDAVYALTDIEPDPRVCMTDAARLLEDLTARLVSDWLPDSA